MVLTKSKEKDGFVTYHINQRVGTGYFLATRKLTLHSLYLLTSSASLTPPSNPFSGVHDFLVVYEGTAALMIHLSLERRQTLPVIPVLFIP